MQEAAYEEEITSAHEGDVVVSAHKCMVLPHCLRCRSGQVSSIMGPPWRELSMCQSCPLMTEERFSQIPTLEERGNMLMSMTLITLGLKPKQIME
jgi:hypothetical protein